MNTVYTTLGELGVIPVVALHEAEKAQGLACALQNGGLRGAEITFRTPAAADIIARIAADFPDFVVGAGTVLTVEQAKTARAAGATFIVSPGFNPAVVSYCLDAGVPIIPGVCTPTEVEQALTWGLDHLKFFPAEAAGGTRMLKALSGPYAQVKFMPTGGIDPENIAAYLQCKNVFACGGSWMVPAAALSAGDFDTVERLTRAAVQKIEEVRV
jgi:2-dehydro-3-deoxyphosphogluconate aldolase/(4S)-4-hydroxy-2-oxoglutarate aldolase